MNTKTKVLHYGVLISAAVCVILRLYWGISYLSQRFDGFFEDWARKVRWYGKDYMMESMMDKLSDSLPFFLMSVFWGLFVFFFAYWRLYGRKKVFAYLGCAAWFLSLVCNFLWRGWEYAEYYFSLWPNWVELFLVLALLAFTYLYPTWKKWFSAPFFGLAAWGILVLVNNLQHYPYFSYWQVYWDSILYSVVIIACFVFMGIHTLADAPPRMGRTDKAEALAQQLQKLKCQFDSGELTEEDYKQQRMICLKNSME